MIRHIPCCILLVGVAAGAVRAQEPRGDARKNTTRETTRRYETRTDHDPNGIGKFYMGREIARVMGHRGAEWLERPERAQEERPDLLVKSLELRPGMVIADIGAGTGYFTLRMAKKVAPTGKVFAVDIQPEMLELLRANAKKQNVVNIEYVLGTESDPRLPGGEVDLALMVDVYHEFAFPYEMTQRICAGLKPGGRVVFVEYRAEDPDVPIKKVHKMSELQVVKEMTAQPVVWVETMDMLPRQHVIVFEKPRD